MNECEVVNQLDRLLLVLVIHSGICEVVTHVGMLLLFFGQVHFFFVYSFNCFIGLVSEQVILCN